MKTAKPEKLDNDSTNIHISNLEGEMQKIHKIPGKAYGKGSGFLFFSKERGDCCKQYWENFYSLWCQSTFLETRFNCAKGYWDSGELHMRGVSCRKSRYKHGRTDWVSNWEKDNSNCWNIFPRKPKRWVSSSIADPEYFSQSHRFADPRQNSGLRKDAPVWEFVLDHLNNCQWRLLI